LPNKSLIMTANDLAIIIVTFNSQKHIARCLDALRAQTRQGFSVTVIDNASSDASASIAQSYGVRVVTNAANTGFAAANNQGVNQTDAEWVFFLNPDAFAENDCIERLIDAVIRDPGIDAFGCTQVMDADPTRLDGMGDAMHAYGIPFRDGFGALRPDPVPGGEVFGPCGAASLWRRLRFHELGGFDESFFAYVEDVDLAFRHRLKGGRAFQVAEAVVRHVGGSTVGRKGALAVQLGWRNRWRSHVMNMPDLLFWPFLPFHGLVLAASLLTGIRGGWAVHALRGFGRGLLETPRLVRRRYTRQRQRTASTIDIARILTWSPTALLSRKTKVIPLRAAGTAPPGSST
jgi:N-acetylglucosaminyl-diphospho-decaprenol L-rhamnosyltransferase